MESDIFDYAQKLLNGFDSSLRPSVKVDRSTLVFQGDVRIQLCFGIRIDIFRQMLLANYFCVSRNAAVFYEEVAKNNTLFGIPVKVTQNADAPSVALLLEPTDSKCYLRRYLDTYLPPFPAIPPGSQNNKNTKETTMVKTKKPAAKKTPAKAAAPKKAAPAKAPAVKKSAAKKPCKKCCKGK